MKTLRTFIAIELQVNIQQALSEVSQALSTRLLAENAVRWVQPENMHLTLRFLGDTDQSKVDSIINGIDSTAKNTYRFQLALDRLGCFPNPRNPRTIWVGLKGAQEALVILHRNISGMLIPLGWKLEDRPFKGHLTIGRVKNNKAVVQAQFPWGLEIDPLQINVDSIALIESRLKPTGAVYTVLHRSIFPS